MTGRKLAGALIVIVLLAFVLPPVAASRVSRARLDRAAHDVSAIAANLAGEALGGTEGSPSALVLAGSGELPRWTADDWPETQQPVPRAIGPDPWGNRYLIVARPRPHGIVVLSAGPNGLVETPLLSMASGQPGAVKPGGDDLAATAPGTLER